ncbi:hypothetical protein A2875_03045 [Candidatus Gottesmanbacteria bacterium RIFCSPHIGHO2_01_FULL_46_14]|uniref:Glycosyltransferase 2-like domain-containing protein n=2 Tax=Candidatus Gottesmaniibacteriota TaxID=1752720 RepID=A0A1F5ZS26_9BACT|nr:MAG: hypothetical protein A2875_03045 [Candidatus Gottesmanbacteria bacterium RIFCSPHIGHO2_01_FULL_46_14]OGG30334.1 MAG: hypothetical protein A2971_01935 [Candidatus Gottesmanbacteria bacterium RIFCSPLOWO2_01_FULL_46_21]
MQKPVLSIIIPAYNEAHHIGACLASLKKQSLREPYEIIVVDNNSKDATSDVAKKYIQLVFLEQKPGASNARNTGVRRAKSELLVFVDADCVVPSDYLKKIQVTFREHPSIAAVGGPYSFTDVGKFYTWIFPQGKDYIYMFALLHAVFGVQLIIGGNLAIRRDALAKAGGFDGKIHDVTQMDDLTLAIRLHQKHLKVLFDPALTVLTQLRADERSLFKDIVSRTYYLLGRLTKYALFKTV